ncbi:MULTISPECIES: hypothetical protein [Sorangium]|uniref:Uncharacterized protein n=1 Tax=Sorangium cellulosum TaxID=56 RepID=A0A4P2QSN7_SORCE|nr:MULTISPECIES: hypothetical protein [Sorangium]AUX33314.1 uncharacterized protein SOCE836_054700 [Sorangium cellulosum]WCQ92627.1 hypothetical protein NQZ70_05370 [Sorangium sp. Soce836]
MDLARFADCDAGYCGTVYPEGAICAAYAAAHAANLAFVVDDPVENAYKPIVKAAAAAGQVASRMGADPEAAKAQVFAQCADLVREVVPLAVVASLLTGLANGR